MELSIRNKWVSFKGSSVVKDEHENDVLKVKGKFFSIRRRKYVCDLNDNVVYQVRNRFWNFFRHGAFVFDKDGNKVATIITKFLSLHDHLNVDSKLGPIVIRGNILGFDYHISLNDKEIGHVSRKISLRDSFVLRLDDDQDPLFFVALVIALDNITDMKRNEAAAWSSSN